MEDRSTGTGGSRHVARDETESGSKGPFCVVYRTAARDRRYGYFCTNCETFDNAVDTMGRIVCNACGNTRKPDEWDAVADG